MISHGEVALTFHGNFAAKTISNILRANNSFDTSCWRVFPACTKPCQSPHVPGYKDLPQNVTIMRICYKLIHLLTHLLTHSLRPSWNFEIVLLRDLGKGFEGIEWIRLLKEALLFVSNGFSLMRSKLTDSWNFTNHIVNWKFVHDVSGRSRNTFWSLVLIIFEGLDLEIINAI